MRDFFEGLHAKTFLWGGGGEVRDLVLNFCFLVHVLFLLVGKGEVDYSLLVTFVRFIRQTFFFTVIETEYVSFFHDRWPNSKVEFPLFPFYQRTRAQGKLG